MKSFILFALAVCGIGVNTLHVSAQQQVNSPYTEVKGKVVISQFKTMDSPTGAEDIFLNALLWAINRQKLPESEKEVVPEIVRDYDKRQLSVEMMLNHPKSGEAYRFLFNLSVSDNILTTLASEICTESTNAIKLVKRFAFEKLQPEKKPKHREYLDEFAYLYQQLIDEMLQYVAGNQPPQITHWAEIKAHRIVKGMTEAECLLSFGKPQSVQQQDQKSKWMYDSSTFIFFEKGKVISLVN